MERLFGSWKFFCYMQYINLLSPTSPAFGSQKTKGDTVGTVVYSLKEHAASWRKTAKGKGERWLETSQVIAKG